MQKQHKQQVTEFLESMQRMNKFKKLKSENNSANSFSVKLKVSGYNELNLMVSSLLKASIVLLNDDARSQACFPFNEAHNNVLTLLEIALQLLPEDEMEVLDDLHKIYLQV
jgi:beta-glucosidase-like glycosyl hydrolase